MRSRSFRRHKKSVKKEKYKKILRRWRDSDDFTDTDVGVITSTHGKACSCNMCGNPRKFNKKKTMQEKRQDISDRQIFE